MTIEEFPLPVREEAARLANDTSYPTFRALCRLVMETRPDLCVDPLEERANEIVRELYAIRSWTFSPKDQQAAKEYWDSFPTQFVGCFVPSKQTIYMIAASQFARIKTIINNYLDKVEKDSQNVSN